MRTYYGVGRIIYYYEASGIMLVKVAAVQCHIGGGFNLEDRLHIFKLRADFICFPEYFLISREQSDFARAALAIKENLEYIRNLSIEFDSCLIGGSVADSDGEALYNSSYMFYKGSIVGRYRKMSPVEGEIKKGILPGDRIFTATIEGVRVGVLICADALNPSLFEAVGKEEIDIIFIPTTSPLRPAERKAEKLRRDREIYLEGARRAGAYIVKTCAVGKLFGKPLQGRSLIVSPWDFIKRVPEYAEEDPALLTASLDIDELREFRRKRRAAAEVIGDSEK